MTNQTFVPTIEARYQFFPRAWAPGVSREVFETLVGADQLYPATKWGNEGDHQLPTDRVEAIDWLDEQYESSPKFNRLTLFTDLPFSSYSFNLVRVEWHEESGFGQLLFWPKHLDLRVPLTAVSDDGLDALAHIAAITEAPLVPIDYRPGKDETITLAARRELTRVVEGTVHAKAAAGPWRGLHRIPWRLMLGTHIVGTIGVDKLSALGPERAIDHGNGVWTLQTTPDPIDSITAEGRQAEREIIAALGPEFFADTDANRLAITVPAFPPELVPQDAVLFERYGERLEPL